MRTEGCGQPSQPEPLRLPPAKDGLRSVRREAGERQEPGEEGARLGFVWRGLVLPCQIMAELQENRAFGRDASLGQAADPLGMRSLMAE
jgi:hypothetical protein